MIARRIARPCRRQGFTLLELMVALTVGGLAIGAMYTVGTAVLRNYHQQHQAANAMTTLRTAMNQIKRDLARAGFMTTPNIAPGGVVTPQSCTTGFASGSLAAISNVVDDVCSSTNCFNLNNANTANGFTADEMVLFGNYETASEYSGLQLIDSQTISVGRNSHAYQTDFTRWYDDPVGLPSDDNALSRVFNAGRMIRIRTTNGQLHFATVSSVTAPTSANDARIVFSPVLPTDCQPGTDGGWVAPVSAIRYYPRNDDDPPSPNPWGPMAQLVREEVDPVGKVNPLPLIEPVDGGDYFNTRVVLDYLVAFNLGFVMTAATATGAPDSYTPGNDTSTFAQALANPQRIRAVTVELSARTPEQDRNLISGTFSGGVWGVTACANLGCYQVFNNTPGSARVRTLRAEVFIPNIAYEGY